MSRKKSKSKTSTKESDKLPASPSSAPSEIQNPTRGRLGDILNQNPWVPAAILTSLVFWSYSEYVPLWDSGSYIMTCFLPAIEKPFDLLNFDCTNHGTIAYSFWISALQLFSFGNVFLIHLSNWVLFLFALWGFSKWHTYLVPNAHWVERALLTIALGIFPPVLANSLNPTPDFGVFASLLVYLACISIGRQSLAAASGIFLVFSKELGVGVYGLSTLLWFGQAWFQSSKPKVTKLLHQNYRLLVPGVFFAIFFVYKRFFRTQTLFSEAMGQSHSDILTGLFNFTLDGNYRGALSGILVMNFMWVITTVCLIAGLKMILQSVSASSRIKLVEKSRFLSFVIFAAITFQVISSYRHYLNVRYYLVLYPSLLILGFCSLQVLIEKLRHRIVASGIIILLFWFSLFDTFDPISKRIFGTFEVGSREMLRMTSLSGECCGYGRDQLVYNLQHTHFVFLMNEFLKRQPLSPRTAHFVDPLLEFYVQGPVDIRTGRRSLSGPNRTFPNYLPISPDGISVFQQNRPRFDRLLFLAFPNFDNKVLERHLEGTFDLSPPETIKFGWSSLYFRELRPKH